jgi:anthranilate synthase component 2
MLLLIDNYDSFTYNIVHYLHEIGVSVRVVLNDEISAEEAILLGPTHILLSPGPGTPEESGISKELLILAAERKIPLLGVCLGHEIIGEVFGAKVVHARNVVHGKTSVIRHSEKNLFSDIPNDFMAARYHSLVIDGNTIPNCINIDAWTLREDNSVEEVMAISHKYLPIYGVQFHPESILTEHGHELFQAFFSCRAER